MRQRDHGHIVISGWHDNHWRGIYLHQTSWAERKSLLGAIRTRVLSGWAGALGAWTRQMKEIFCYFDNDEIAFWVKSLWESYKKFDSLLGV